MSMWSDRVSEPFRSDPWFWRSLSASLAAGVTLIAATVVFSIAGGATAAAYAVPILLLAVAAILARSSSGATRPQFETREQWRDAERDAVACALRLRRSATSRIS